MSVDRELGLAVRMLPVAGVLTAVLAQRVDLFPERITLFALSALLGLAVVYRELSNQ